MEVTHNLVSDSPHYDTYHPHIHTLIAVNKSYFTSRDYLSHERWVEIWQKAMRLGYRPQVYIQKVKANKVTPSGEAGGTAYKAASLGKAVAELSGYGTKEKDIIIPDDWELTVETVRVLDKALANRRFVAFGGMMGDYHRKLQLDDPDDGDLVHVDGEEPAADEGVRYVWYGWFVGYRQYREIINC